LKAAGPYRRQLLPPCNPFELPLAPEVRLELGGHPEHVEEALAGGGAGVDRLLRGLQDWMAPEMWLEFCAAQSPEN
jgi:hypothetical protein